MRLPSIPLSVLPLFRSRQRYARVDSNDDDSPINQQYGSFERDTAVEYSPLQRWITPLLNKVRREDTLEMDSLPILTHNSRYLRQFVLPLRARRVAVFLCSAEIGLPLLISGLLELLACVFSLSSPFLLHQMLVSEDTTFYVVLIVAVGFLSVISGRAKDQITRMLAMRTSAMLQSSIFEKSMQFSCSARVTRPLGTLLSCSTHDMEFVRNYLIKFHDIWSGPLQLLVLFGLAIRIMGYHGVVGSVVLITLLFSQSKANFLLQKSGDNYMKCDEQRLTSLSQSLSQIRGIKSLALEPVVRESIDTARAKQVKSLHEYLQLTFCFFTSVNQMTPGLVALASFFSFWVSGNKLTAEVVFPALTIFDMSFSPASKISLSITRQFSAIPILRRILSLLSAEEGAPLAAPKRMQPNTAVCFENAIFRHPSAEDAASSDFSLGPINAHIPIGSLVVVLGPSGSGKSTLLAAMTGQCISDESSYYDTRGKIALAAQSPWVMSGTVRDNILFRSEFDSQRYHDVLRTCCLDEDLALWPKGDLTKIGERGATLSGGQRARVSLARAIYSRADILLLDDPLSAVDNRVADRLFHGCIQKLPQTVILVTHQPALLQYADLVAVLENGLVKEFGAPAGLLGKSSSITQFAELSNSSPFSLRQQELIGSQAVSTAKPLQPNPDEEQSEEDRLQGAVPASLYRFYWAYAGGRPLVLRTAIFLSMTVVARTVNNAWFVLWIGDKLSWSQGSYMTGYLVSTVTQTVAIASLGFILVKGSVRASSLIHSRLVKRLFAAHVSFFDNQPLGRIMNRLSLDIQAIDERIMNAADGLFVAASSLLASVAILTFTSPYLILAVAPILTLSYYVFSAYRICARETRRLCSVLDSPPITLVTETVDSISSVKAFGAEDFFMEKHEAAIDKSMSALLLRYSLETWMTTRAELLSALLTLCVGLLVMIGTVPKEKAGLALSTTITLAKHVHLALWALINVEVEMNSVERLHHYMQKVSYESQNEDTSLPDSHWPETGSIKFVNVGLKYPGAETAALADLNLQIPAGQRIGIVGRTGSGKSSIIATLTRLVEHSSGQIFVSDAETQTVPLRRLRLALHVLPQDPVIFEESLRKNLDLWGQFTDSALCDALRVTGLYNTLQNQLAGEHVGLGPDDYSKQVLDFKVKGKGENFSKGQVQLICLTRAILVRPKILILDEATASIDPAADKVIQQTLRECFDHETTIICIAHRVSSVMWMERIVVMDGGRIAREGSPSEIFE